MMKKKREGQKANESDFLVMNNERECKGHEEEQENSTVISVPSVTLDFLFHMSSYSASKQISS